MASSPDTPEADAGVLPPGDAEVIWRALRRANQLLESEIEQRLSAAGQQPLLWLEVTATLARLPEGRLRQRELAGLVAISPSGLSRLLDRIEAAGLVTRHSSPSDRRGADVQLTQQGQESVEASRPVIRAALEHHLVEPLGQSGEEVRSGLRRIVSSLA